MHVETSRGTPYQLDKDLDGGGEARIWTVQGQSRLLAKIYHQPTPQHEAKLKAMLAKVPAQPGTHTAIAWPTETLYRQGKFVGFFMPYAQGNKKIFHLYNPALRRRANLGFNRIHFHRAGLNLAIAAASIHAKGHVIGDVNESNILVNPQALVTLVDTDSFQVEATPSQIYRCAVGKPEYTPPELQGIDFKTVDRTLAHDHFGLAVLIFQLLMEGHHPFAGVLTSQLSVGRVNLYCIKQGLFPYQYNATATPASPVNPPPSAPALTTLHPELQALFMRAFVAGHRHPNRRPVAEEWQRTLDLAESALIKCPQDASHIYSNHLNRCPLCVVSTKKERPAAVIQPSTPIPHSALPPQLRVPISHRARPIRKLTQDPPTRDTWLRIGLSFVVFLIILTVGLSTQYFSLPALLPTLSARLLNSNSERFNVGQLAQVLVSDGLRLRESPNISANEVHLLKQSTSVTILGGPVEADGYRWWQVEDGEGRVGWSAEGDDETLWLGVVE